MNEVNNSQNISATSAPLNSVRGKLSSALLAEFAGTFLITTVIYIASISLAFSGSKVQPLNLALITASGVFIAYVLFAKYSGGDFNPAVTLFKLIRGATDAVSACLYFAAQFVGALLSSVLLYTLLPEGPAWTIQKWLAFATNGFGSNSPASEYLASLRISFDWPFAVFIELLGVLLILAAYLKISKCECAPEKPLIGKHAGVIAVAYAVAVASTQCFTGSGLNPARSLAIAIFANDYSRLGALDWPISNVWVFVVTPLVAAFLFAAIIRALQPANRLPKPAKAPKPPKAPKTTDNARTNGSADNAQTGSTTAATSQVETQQVQPLQDLPPVQAAPATATQQTAAPAAKTPEELLAELNSLSNKNN